ncbi:Hypothetical Protein RradSPS_2382 [Rubrobacter radiotolerans]|uniref:Uncharacterized protein n=1 Tax=Rubrobacter radiotolerans TaxID=42256 RepID=A0A023X6N4_RUBRA|nr:hypothetical protein [Rubrobacter radiotolerans]AHY47665.1 Hypothetical Protein RradSPS_2382 [Rubrobacter radiotolerans]MDX5895068.1 hypothetical protein [Rubrobacter radiotolerans]SMC07382.1 basal body protein [Rubrobacter radiotolerans DSM 5868]
MNAERDRAAANEERARRLEEVVDALESLRSGLAGTPDFDEARLDAHLKTALGSARAALSLATGLRRGDAAGPEGH